MVSDKGVWPRLRVREGFSEELMPEPRSERGEGDRRASTPQGIAWSNAESTVHRATSETFSSLGEPMCSSSCLNKAFLSNFPLLFAES